MRKSTHPQKREICFYQGHLKEQLLPLSGSPRCTLYPSSVWGLLPTPTWGPTHLMGGPSGQDGAASLLPLQHLAWCLEPHGCSVLVE